MEDVDAFLASLDQFSSPTIDAGIQRQQELQSGTAAAPSASPTSAAQGGTHRPHRRQPRDSSTGASRHPETLQVSLLSNSGDHTGGNDRASQPSAASPATAAPALASSLAHNRIRSRSPQTWWCARCTAENTSQMQSCACCHRRCHRAEEPQTLLTSSRAPPFSVSPACPRTTMPGSSSEAFFTTAPENAYGLELGSGLATHGSGAAHGGGPRWDSVVPAGPGEVSCPRCTFLNSSSRRTCEMCDGALPSSPLATATAASDPFPADVKDGGASLVRAPPPDAMYRGTRSGLSAAVAAAVPPTALAGFGGARRLLCEGSPAYQSPPAPESATSVVSATASRVALQAAAREASSSSPVELGSRSTSSSALSSSESGDDNEESEEERSSEEEAAAHDAADHRELVRFLETLQSVKFDALPCAAVPASMRARAELRPFQLQALHWLLSREQHQLNHARAPVEDTGSLILKDKAISAFENDTERCADSEDDVTYAGSGCTVGGGSRGEDGALTNGAHFAAENRCLAAPSSSPSTTASRPPCAAVASCTPDSGAEDDASMSIRGQEMARTVRGGVFADYMGLGKTRTLIALCETTRAPRVDRVTGSLVESTATLIVCPTSLLEQWVSEIHRCVERPASAPLRILVYYGARKRRLSLFQVAQSYDYVLTTYKTLSHKQSPVSDIRPTHTTSRAAKSGGAASVMAFNLSDTDDAVAVASGHASAATYDVDRRLQTEVDKLFMIRWSRIILDEAHYMRNMRTQQSRACLKLSGVCRWVVTATPVQNSLNDLYPLLRFLDVPHFSSLAWWNSEIVRYYNLDPLHPRPVTALSILFGSILLRRTPDSIVDGRPILELPPKQMITHTIRLSREEMRFYQSIHANATQKLNALRDRDVYATRTPLTTFTTAFEMLMRCRQTCLHPYIVVAALRRCHRLPGAEAECGTTAALRGPDCASATAKNAGGEAARQQREDDQRTARAIDAFIDGVVLRRLRTVKAGEFFQSLVEEIRQQKLDSRECIICLDTVNRPAILPCAHVFCVECITHALQATRRCPLCKRSAKPSELLLVPVELLDPASQQPQESAGGVDGRESAAESAPEVPLNSDLTDMSNWSLQLSSKTQYLINTIRSLPADDKVVVFSAFLVYLRYAQHWLQAAGVSCAIYSGSMSMKQKHSLLKLFGDASQPASPRVLLATTSSCGVGLNLTCANHCFLMEPSWNPGTEEQALNRIHRIGQTKPVTITKLIAEGTVEQNISQLCERKRALSTYCFHNGETGATAADGGGSRDGRLRTADLLELFAPEESSESSDDDDSSEEDEADAEE
ncbi:hypothetical protein LSCM1_03210 [Leishmania martiniquensis]|uniref:RanBP-type and C3HC4-type zinc finger-containing protein 1 n=1 Tax=Leishmania martiniquensis TaxID=1580590 RepID=A0A836KQG3_9TRYP|nr:hypothetical protein LSCM1_03210 [Leishmania martiniquensis]